MEHPKVCDVRGGWHHNHLNQLMSECRISGAKLASICDVHVNTVSNWRTGKIGAPGMLFAYLELLAKVKSIGRV